VPLLMALTRLRTNTSPGASDRSGCVLISPRPGATTQNARASCTEITIEQRVSTEVESADPRTNRLVGLNFPSIACAHNARARGTGSWTGSCANRLRPQLGEDAPQRADTRRERVTVVLDDIVKLLG
jgi:hypothetical protein